MKNLLLPAALFLAFILASPANAIDFKVKGWWLVSMQYGQNGNFSDHGHQGYDYLEDEFEARSRVRIQLDAIASESLSGQVYFEIGKFIWGKGTGAQSGGALGAPVPLPQMNLPISKYTWPLRLSEAMASS